MGQVNHLRAVALGSHNPVTGERFKTHMQKTIRLGTNKEGWDVFCKIEIKGGNLSISGVEGPMRNGDAKGSCGQISMSKPEITKLAPGWTKEMLTRFWRVWDEWHLNDSTPGTPEQEKAIREWEAAGNKYEYGAASEHLKGIGLYEVPATPEIKASALGGIDGDTYKYGQRWLKRELPQDVINFLASLPDTDKTPAWV